MDEPHGLKKIVKEKKKRKLGFGWVVGARIEIKCSELIVYICHMENRRTLLKSKSTKI